MAQGLADCLNQTQVPPDETSTLFETKARESNPNNPYVLIWDAILSRTIARMSCLCCQRNPRYSDQIRIALEQSQNLLQLAEPHLPLNEVISELIAMVEITGLPDPQRYPHFLSRNPRFKECPN